MAFQEDPANLAGWQDIWNDIQQGAQWINRIGGGVQNVGNQVSNAGNNLANVTSWRLDGKTVVAGALLVSALVYASRRR